MSLRRTLRAILTILAATTSIGASAVDAQQVRAVGPTPPRLSFVDGEVSYWRPGAEDWTPAQINTALAAGDSLYAGNGANFEIEVGTRAYVRAGSGTELGIESLETGYLQLRVPLGHAAVDLRRLPEGQQIEIGTPNGAFLIDESGYYRFDVEDDSTRLSTSRGARARVVPAGGEEIHVDADEQVVVTGTESASVSRVAAASADAWDRWNYDRTAQLGEAPRSAQYVPPAVAGVDDLDRYGDWRETPKYGHVWVPRDVSADWAPYSTGRWVWDGYYGWTWVDDSPWGWAPYHYGRWCWNDSYWGWAPGPVAVRPVYAPALVAFFGGPHVGISLRVGTPFVSWVALGWGEPVVPWWGPRGFVGRPYWGGWGGPRVVNNTVINNTTIINVNNINRYDNFRNRRAVIGVDSDRFGRGRGEHIRVDPDRVRNLRPVRGELGVRPVRASLVAREGRGQRPPDRIQNRRVVATRAPQDPARLPRAAGLVRDDSRRKAAPPRIVSPRGERSRGRDEAGRTAPPLRGVERSPIGEPAETREGRRGRPNAIERRPGRPGDGRDDASAERRDRAGQPPSGIDRVPGRERGNAAIDRSRGAPQPPVRNQRAPRERDRHGREQGGVDVREQGRAPAPPAVERGGERQRSRRDEASVPPPSRERGRGQYRGSYEIQIPRPEAAPPADRGGGRERGRSRVEQPQRAPRMPQMEAPRRETAPRNERQPRNDSGRSRESSSQRGSVQRQSAPERRQVEQPRNQRQAEPRPQRQAEPPRKQRDGGDARPNDARGSSRDGGNSGGGRGRDRERQPAANK